jgi:hypothetical protein
MSLTGMLGGLIDSEGIVTEKIQTTLDDLSEELNEPNHRNFFITIIPINEEFDFECIVYHRTPDGIQMVRQITIKEIVDK